MADESSSPEVYEKVAAGLVGVILLLFVIAVLSVS